MFSKSLKPSMFTSLTERSLGDRLLELELMSPEAAGSMSGGRGRRGDYVAARQREITNRIGSELGDVGAPGNRRSGGTR